MHRFLVLIALLAFAGCTTTFNPKPLPPDHPASVQTPEAPHSGARRLLAKDELSRKTEMELTRQDVPSPDFQNSEMSHDMRKTEAVDKPAPVTPTPAAAVYTCVMHPEVQSDKPGKCPKCGMTLVKKEAGAK